MSAGCAPAADVTENEFRRLALTLPEAEEREHMGHPDFRVGGKIFATLGYPGKRWAMVKLTLDQQDLLVRGEPDVFAPIKGAWGRRGATNVLRALIAAWRNTAPKRLAREFEET
jgi:hypothetical protein